MAARLVPQTLESSTAERREVEITTSADPTSTPPEFALITDTALTEEDFVAGTYDGTWDAETGTVKALSPLVGEGQALPAEEGTTYRHFVRWTVGVEQPVRLFEILRFT